MNDLKNHFGSPISPFEARIRVEHSRYLKWLGTFFEQVKTGAVETEKAEQVVDQLIELFQEEAVQVQNVCTTVGGLEELRRAWADQTERGVAALDQAAFCLLDGGQLAELDQCFEQIQSVMVERLPYHSKVHAALKRCA